MHAVNPVDGAVLVLVPAGSFVMGSDRATVLDLWRRLGWDSRWIEARVGGADWVGELHPHEVELAVFWIYERPVTIAQYHRFMRETGHPAPSDPRVHGPLTASAEGGLPTGGVAVRAGTTGALVLVAAELADA